MTPCLTLASFWKVNLTKITLCLFPTNTSVNDLSNDCNISSHRKWFIKVFISQIFWPTINCLKLNHGLKCYGSSRWSMPSIHYSDVIMSRWRSNDRRLDCLHQNSASLVFVRGIHRWPVNSPHNGPVTQKMFPCDVVIMCGTRPLVNDWNTSWNNTWWQYF